MPAPLARAFERHSRRRGHEGEPTAGRLASDASRSTRQVATARPGPVRGPSDDLLGRLPDDAFLRLIGDAPVRSLRHWCLLRSVG